MASELDTASDPTTPEDHLLELARASDPDVRRAVAQNMAAPKEAMAALLREFPEDVLDNPASTFFDTEPGGDLHWASQEDVMALAETSSSESVLLRLMGVKSFSVRSKLAQNSAMPQAALLAFAKDVWAIRSVVIDNPNLPEEAWAILAMDDDSAIRSRVAKHERVPVEILGQLAKASEMSVRVNVAKNTRTRPEDLDLLSLDEQSSVRIDVAANANTPIKTLQRLLSLSEPYADVRDEAKETLRVLSIRRKARR